jgi:hypothetical protein
MPNFYFFIVGCPRSGTALLQWVVNAHPPITVMPDARAFEGEEVHL